MPVDGSFASLAERHLGPVLTRAGFAPGQWASGRQASSSHTVDEDGRAGQWATTYEPWAESGTYCAHGGDYVQRYPVLSTGREERYAAVCVDIVVAGTVDRGVERVDVEFEPLARLLRHIGHHDDADLVDDALAAGDAGSALPVIAAVFDRLYRTGTPGLDPG